MIRQLAGVKMNEEGEMKRLAIGLFISMAAAAISPGCAPAAQGSATSLTQRATAVPLTQASAPSPSTEPAPTAPLSLAGILPDKRIENIAEEYGLLSQEAYEEPFFTIPPEDGIASYPLCHIDRTNQPIR